MTFDPEALRGRHAKELDPGGKCYWCAEDWEDWPCDTIQALDHAEEQRKRAEQTELQRFTTAQDWRTEATHAKALYEALRHTLDCVTGDCPKSREALTAYEADHPENVTNE